MTPIRSDAATKRLYSTDASIYICEPAGAALPRSEEELAELVHWASKEGVTLLPRGAGTSLSGQAITSGVIVDLSSWNSIRIEGDRAHVQPGAVIDAIDRAASPTGYRFGPTPASSNRATIAGLLANNGTGARSIKFGMASDHLHSARVLLSTGEIRRFTRGDLERGDSLAAAVLEIADPVKDSPRWPRTWRNASGLDIRGIYTRHSLLPLFCGSEGSLGIILDSEVSLVPRAQSSMLAIFFYDDLVAAMRHVPALLETGPSAIELMDRRVIEQARRSRNFELRLIKETPEALFVVEYEDKDETARALALGAKLILKEPADQKEIWTTRKEGLGLLMSMRGQRRPIPFIEDCAVPVEKLPEYVERLDGIIRRHGTEGAYYAHASAGCLHIRPLLDLHRPEEIETMDAITSETVDLVAELGGTLTGEHGDGRSKTPYHDRIFGKELVGAFDRIRKVFDPAGIFRPAGDTRYRTQQPARPWKPALRWETDFLDEVERCNGEGACRKMDGVMCPSFQASGDESLSTRGRANLLRGLLAGEDLTDAISVSLEKCLGCKACSSECPSQVDMAAMKAEFIHHRGPTLRDRFFGHYEKLAQAGRLFGVPLESLVKKAIGVHPKSMLPVPTLTGFFERWRKQQQSPPAAAGGKYDAILFVDTHMEYFEPAVGLAAMKIFEAIGLKVFPSRPGCCGRPAFSRGLVDKARAEVEKLIFPGDYPVIVIEPSCLSMFQEDSLKLSDHGSSLAKRAVGIETFLLRHEDRLRDMLARSAVAAPGDAVLFHTHCHQKAAGSNGAAVRILNLFQPATEINSGCCGMAGSFGYEKENYNLSLAVAEDRFLPALRKAGGVVAASGRSCREMAARHGLTALHPVQLMADRLPSQSEAARR